MIVLLLLSIICVNARPLGVVSSVWSALLGTKNYSVPVLVELLAQTGVSYIELRQGSLPGYEDAQLFPNASALFELVTQFPKLRFSYAFSLPFLSFPDEQDTWNSTLFVSALAAAVDMARNENGVRFVRVVDVKTNNKNFNASLNADIKDILGKMSFFAAKSKLNVGVENAALQWATFWELLFCASPANQPTPSLVFDPCNIAWVSDGVHDGPLVIQRGVFFVFFDFLFSRLRWMPQDICGQTTLLCCTRNKWRLEEGLFCLLCVTGRRTGSRLLLFSISSSPAPRCCSRLHQLQIFSAILQRAQCICSGADSLLTKFRKSIKM
jgi:hypothetical protein